MSFKSWGRGNIFKQEKSSFWWIRYPDGTGKQRRESAKTEDEAKARQLLERRLLEIERGEKPATARERRRTINELIDELEKDYANRERDSAHNLKSVMKPIRDLLGERRAISVTTADLNCFILERREAGSAHETINRQLRHLAQAFRLQDAIPLPKFPPLPKGRARDVYIAPAEQERLLAAFTESHYRDATAFKFATGWRGNEVLTLQWKHVHDDRIRLIAENTKGNEARDYPLTGTVAEIIERWRKKRSPISPLVFHLKGRALSYPTWRRRWRSAALKAGLQGVSLHDARRAFVTDTINAGVDLSTTMMLSGHKTDSMVRRYHISTTEALKRAIEKREQYVESRAAERKVVSLAERRKLSKSRIPTPSKTKKAL